MLTQAIKAGHLKDWKNTPIHKNEMEGASELDAIVNSVPEFEIIRLANFSRDPADPFSFGNKVLLDMTLKKQADLTEVQYWLGVLRKRDFPNEDLLNLHHKASMTLMTQFMKMGRLTHYDKIMEKYPVNTEDTVELRKTVTAIWIRCLKTYNIIGQLRSIFRNYKKHQTAYQTLAELGIYMQRPGFNVTHTQALMDFFVQHGSSLCKQITEILEDDILP